MNYADRFDPKYNGELLERLRRIPLLARTLDLRYNPTIRPLLEYPHLTTRLAATFITAHYYDGNCGGVDVIDLLQRFDSENKSAFLAYLGEL